MSQTSSASRCWTLPFSHPEPRRRFSYHPPMDFVKAAFAIALDEDLDQEELKKRGRGGEDAPPTGH